MKRLRSATSLWLARQSTSRLPRYPAATGLLAADAVIVGGGVTGAITAWMLARQGAQVVLVERHRVAHGSTAASSALLMQEPDVDLARLRERYGARDAGAIWRHSRRATRQLVSALETFPAACALSPCDSIYYTEEDAAALRRELALRKENGAKVRWLDPAALARDAGLAAAGAIRSSGNAQADPVRICLAFLDAAGRAGAGVFEGSPVQRVDTTRDGVVVQTPHARIIASHIIVATGYATPDFKPLLRRFQMSHTYVVATPPLAPEVRRRLGLGDVMLWDTGRPYYYARWTRDGRLLLGGGDRPVAGGQSRRRRLADGVADVRAHFSRLYPALHNIETDTAWEGVFASTSDGLPFIGPHRRYPRHLFALGYGGNGLTFAHLAAALLARRLTGTPDPDERLFAFTRSRRRSRGR